MSNDGNYNEFTVGEFSEFKRSRHARSNSGSDQTTFEHAGELGDTELRVAFNHARAAYSRLIERNRLPEDLPSRFYETELSRSTRGIEGTETASRALSKGDTGTLRNFVGAPDKSTDLSGREAINRLNSVIHDESTPLLYIAGRPGCGKTTFATLLCELWAAEHRSGQIGTNIRSLEPHPPDRLGDGPRDERVSHVGGITELEEWLEQDSVGDVPKPDDGFTPKMILLDESSSSLRGGGAQGHKVRKLMAPLLMRVRRQLRNSGLVILIGHSGSDIAPSLRSISKFIQKDSQKSATVYKSVKNRSGKGEIASFDGIPAGNYQKNQFEKPGQFNLDPENGENNDGIDVTESERKRDIDILSAVSAKQLTGMSNPDIAEKQLSGNKKREWVRQQVKAYDTGELDSQLSEWGCSVREHFGI